MPTGVTRLRSASFAASPSLACGALDSADARGAAVRAIGVGGGGFVCLMTLPLPPSMKNPRSVDHPRPRLSGILFSPGRIWTKSRCRFCRDSAPVRFSATPPYARDRGGKFELDFKLSEFQMRAVFLPEPVKGSLLAASLETQLDARLARPACAGIGPSSKQ